MVGRRRIGIPGISRRITGIVRVWIRRGVRILRILWWLRLRRDRLSLRW